MFQLDLAPTFEATVRIPQPGGARVAVRVRFHYLDAEQYAQTFEACRDKPAVEWVGRLVAGWETEDRAGQFERLLSALQDVHLRVTRWLIYPVPERLLGGSPVAHPHGARPIASRGPAPRSLLPRTSAAAA